MHSRFINSTQLLTATMIDVPCLPGAAVLLVGGNQDRARELTAAATLQYGEPAAPSGMGLVHELHILGHAYLEPERAEAVRAIRRQPELGERQIEAADVNGRIYAGQEPVCTVLNALGYERARIAVPNRTLDTDALDSDEHQGHVVMRCSYTLGQSVASWVIDHAAREGAWLFTWQDVRPYRPATAAEVETALGRAQHTAATTLNADGLCCAVVRHRGDLIGALQGRAEELRRGGQQYPALAMQQRLDGLLREATAEERRAAAA